MSRSNRRYEDGEEEEEEEEESYEEGVEERSGDLSLEKTMAFMNNLRLQERYLNVQEESENVPSKMHLARGLGVFTDGGGYNIGGGNGGTGQNKHKPVGYGDNGRDGASMAEYYKKMVEDNPGNPLLLRNYAEFLYKVSLNHLFYLFCKQCHIYSKLLLLSIPCSLRRTSKRRRNITLEQY